MSSQMNPFHFYLCCSSGAVTLSLFLTKFFIKPVIKISLQDELVDPLSAEKEETTASDQVTPGKKTVMV